MIIVALIGWMVLGLVAGALGRLLVPGEQPMGFIKTMALGVVGSFAGGFVSRLFTGDEGWLQPSGWIMSTIGAALVLALYIYFTRRNATSEPTV